MSSNPDQRTRLDDKSGAARVERRSVIRIAGERLKEYADKLNANARWINKFLHRK